MSYQQANKTTGRQSTKIHTGKLTKMCTKKLTGKVYQVNQDSTEGTYQKPKEKSTVMSTKLMKTLLKLAVESVTMKSTRRSLKWISNNDYLVKYYLEVNATC
jgi:hypothetical protein